MTTQQQVRPIREGFVADEPKPVAVAAVAAPAPAIAPSPAAAAEPAPPPAPEPYVDKWPIRVKLMHKGIRNDKNETVHELVFREPTGGDINRYGNPVRVDTMGEVIIDERKMSVMMGALSGILSPLLDAMDPRDWNSCAYRLRRFFLPDPEAW